MGLGIAFLVVLALAGAGAGAAMKKKPDLPPVTPDPPVPGEPLVETIGKSGTVWLTQNAASSSTVMPGAAVYVNVYLKEGSLGAKKTFKVLRFEHNPNQRVLIETVPGVDQKIVDLAMADFSIGKPVATPKKVEEEVLSMSTELKEKLAKALQLLTVNEAGQIVGPVVAEAVQFATTVAGELERAGFPAAATMLRNYAQAAAKLVAEPDRNKQVPLPDELPADIKEKIQRAIQLERDPGKLREILAALKAFKANLPAEKKESHAKLEDAIGVIDALIVQVEAAQAYKKSLEDIQNTIKAKEDPAPIPTKKDESISPPVATVKTYTVKAGDSARRIAFIFTGSEDRASELDRSNPTKKPLPTKGVWTGEVLTLPDSWPATPKHAPGTPPPAPTPSPTPAPTPTGQRTFRVYKGHKGPWQLASDMTGNGARWKELIATNPKKRLLPDKSNFVSWNEGEVIVIPASWPDKQPTALPEQPTTVPPAPAPQPTPIEKTPVEMAADAVVKHLWSIQRQYGMPGAKGKEDMVLIKRFQSLAGDTADGMAGPGTLARTAQHGQSNLPLVMRWPKSATSTKVLEYRNVLTVMADKSRSEGNTTRADELSASAARERGQAGIVGPMPA
jgi:hypothetical protein